MAAIAAIIGRILLGALFVVSGIGKILNPAGTAQMMEAMSPFPGMWAQGVGIFEVVAGLVLASGFMTRIASVLLVGFTLVATLFFHRQLTDPVQQIMALKNLSIVGGLLMVFAYGQVRGKIGVIDERGKRYDAELRAARAEGRAEGLAEAPAASTAAPVAAAPVAAAPVAATGAVPLTTAAPAHSAAHDDGYQGVTGRPGAHPRTVHDRDGDGIDDRTGRDAPGTHPRTAFDRDGDGHPG